MESIDPVFDFQRKSKNDWNVYHLAAFFNYEEMFEISSNSEDPKQKWILENLHIMERDKMFR